MTDTSKERIQDLLARRERHDAERGAIDYEIRSIQHALTTPPWEAFLAVAREAWSAGIRECTAGPPTLRHDGKQIWLRYVNYDDGCPAMGVHVGDPIEPEWGEKLRAAELIFNEAVVQANALNRKK